GELDSDERVAGVAAGRRRCPPPGEDQFLGRADLTISSLDHVVLVAKLHFDAIRAADAQLELGDPRLEFRAWRHPLRERLRIGPGLVDLLPRRRETPRYPQRDRGCLLRCRHGILLSLLLVRRVSTRARPATA